MSGSWGTAADWSTGSVPQATDTACVTVPGTYTVDLSAGGYSAAELVIGGTSGTQTVDIDGSAGTANLNLGGTGIINANGVLELSATAVGNPSLLGGSLTVASGGVLSTTGASGTSQIQSNLTNDAGGTVTIGGADSRLNGSSNSDTNDGTLQVLSGAQLWLRLNGTTYTNEPGSTLTVAGTMKVDDGGGSPATLVQAGGTGTGNPVELAGGVTLEDSAGTGSFANISAGPGNTLSGTIPAGQTVIDDASSGGVDLDLSGTVTDDGTLNLNALSGYSAFLTGGALAVGAGGVFSTTGATGTSQIQTDVTNDAGGTTTIGGADSRVDGTGISITNDGTLQVLSGDQLWLRLDGSTYTNEPGSTLTVAGTMKVDDGGGSPATFVQAGGTGTGNPVELAGGVTLEDSAGTGAFFDITFGNTLTGTVPAGQTVTVDATSQSVTLDLSGTVTDEGSLVLSAASGFSPVVSGGALTVASGGVLSTTGASGTLQIESDVTNEAGGTVTIGGADSRLSGAAATNSGTWQVTNGNQLLVDNGATLSNTAAGTIGVVVDATTDSTSGISGSGVSLDGTLSVTTIGTPTVGESFTPITGPVTGTFAALSSAPWKYAVTYPAAAVVLTLQPPTPIVQGPPTSGTTTVPASAGFTDTLSVVSGYVGTVTYTETSSVPAGLVVNADGDLKTTGSLAATSYVVDGTTADAYGDTGTFTYTLTVTRVTQTVAITSTPVSPAVDGTYTVTATGGGSGNPVTFSSATPATCTVSGATVSFIGAGVCTVDANQAGNGDYAPAATVTQTFDVAPNPNGYRLVAADGGAFDYGIQYGGSLANEQLNAPIVGMANEPGPYGYLMVGADGGVFAFAGANYYGSLAGQPLASPIVGIAATPDGGGYWLVSQSGQTYNFGNAPALGALSGLNQPIVGIASDPSGEGAWLVAADGGVFALGNAPFEGSLGDIALNAPIVGIAAAPNGEGYVLAAADGGVFAFGDSLFYGSATSFEPSAPIVGIAETNSGNGYWLVGSDGGVYAFGDAPYLGSMAGVPLNKPMVGIQHLGLETG